MHTKDQEATTASRRGFMEDPDMFDYRPNKKNFLRVGLPLIAMGAALLSPMNSSSMASERNRNDDDHAGAFFEINAPSWSPSNQEVVVGIVAKLPNNCSFIESIDSVIGNKPVNGFVELNIYVEVMDVPFNIEPEVAKEIGCENGERYVYEKVNFGVLEPGSYIVQVIENNEVSIAKKIHVSKYPIEPDFAEPNGYYNIGSNHHMELMKSASLAASQ
ncbi:MAG: hypothetical protein R3B45_11125 [Bdellovibrionota bacterium]